MKCLLTHETCKADNAGYWDNGDSCPILAYKNSNRSSEGTQIRDDYCRYYGIARAKELQKIYREDVKEMAAKKKDFSTVKTDRMYNTIAEATAEPQEEQEAQEVQEAPKTRKNRRTYTKAEAQEFLDDLRTAGRKGVRLPRINMAFSPECYDYIRTVSKVRGETMTEFLNFLVKKSLEENRDIYDKAIEFRNSI